MYHTVFLVLLFVLTVQILLFTLQTSLCISPYSTVLTHINSQATPAAPVLVPGNLVAAALNTQPQVECFTDQKGTAKNTVNVSIPVSKRFRSTAMAVVCSINTRILDLWECALIPHDFW